MSDAPSGKNVLAQTDGDDTDYRFPIAYTGPDLKDLSLSVKCKAIAGKGDQGCGILWRLKDKDNYYITRANALEDNVHQGCRQVRSMDEGGLDHPVRRSHGHAEVGASRTSSGTK